MWIIIAGIAALLFGYFVYSKIVERVFLPYKEPTPAISMSDDLDYVPMPTWKNHLIQLLNIAGTGPIFGALMGAKWGPIVFLWIIFGSILGGAVHDYMSGMMSTRNGGATATGLINKYIGNWMKYPALIFLTVLMVIVSATFARSASDLLVILTDLPVTLWMVVIMAYFVLSALLPINKLIGKIYPIFGVMLILMAVVVIGGVVLGGYSLPTMSLENLHPAGAPIFPDMCITVACGAVSGFHATQSPMTARCMKHEKNGRCIFYGAMMVEALIALIWASAGLAFYGDTSALSAALASGGASYTVYEIATTVAGPVGGVLGVLGVIVCPITTGDTALRSARMMIQDSMGLHNDDKKSTLLITAIVTGIIIFLCTIDFSVLWSYMSWMNQTLACIMLWTATIFLLTFLKRKIYSLVTALPAMFMTMVTVSYIMHSNLGLRLDYNVSIIIAAAVTVIVTLAYLRVIRNEIKIGKLLKLNDSE